jgi:hypothetical protein
MISLIVLLLKLGSNKSSLKGNTKDNFSRKLHTLVWAEAQTSLAVSVYEAELRN